MATQAPVTMYTTPICPYCVRAKALLQRKGAEYREVDLSTVPDARAEMQRLGGGYTVPQIWIGERHIGGSDDLYALERAGELDALLFPSAS